MTTKVEQATEFLLGRSTEEVAGTWIGPVDSLQRQFEASIGTVSARLSTWRSAVARHWSVGGGPAGGYYVADPQRHQREPFPETERDLTLAGEALIDARRIRTRVNALIATLEAAAG